MNEEQKKLINLLKNRQAQLKYSVSPEAVEAAKARGEARLIVDAHDEQVLEVPIVKFPPQPAGTVMVHPNVSQAEMKALAQVSDDPPETFFYARNQTEMSEVQKELVAWSESRVKLLKRELREAQENLDIATKRKWKKAPWERQVTKAEKKLTFYEKVEAALKAGYTIVPDMNVDLFAIRTTRKSAKQNKTKGQWNRPRDQQTNSPPLGEGRYVTPQGEQVWANEVKKHEPGKAPEYEIARWVEGHDEEIDFPFRMAKPAILSATADAMAGKFFDEMGVLPRFRVQADPVVVGRIAHKDGYTTKRFNFLIVWFIDTREL